MILRFSAPSKTFLVGEYAVLSQGRALVLATSPRFELVVRRGEPHIAGIPQKSPAYRWLEQRRPLLDRWQIEFVDPHSGQGGLGASGAQFLLAHTLTTYLQSSFETLMNDVPIRDVWHDYQVLSQNSGSGADLLAQNVGGVCEIDMSTLTARRQPWPYAELGWCIVRTHQKVPTHEHLQTLDRDAMSLLTKPAFDTVSAFATAPSEVFIGHLKEFAHRLRELQLQAPTTLSLINVLEREDWCLLAKGCGALGADTVLFLFPSQDKERVQSFLRKQRLSVIASIGDLSHGWELQCRHEL